MHAKQTIRILGLLVCGALLSTHVSAQPNFGRPPQGGGRPLRCESQNNRRNYCAADTRGGVTLVRQVSQADCVQGRTWGFDVRGIWVDRGCRADFQVNPYSGMPNWGNPGQGHRPPFPGGPNWGKGGACFYKEAGFGGEYFCMR